MLAAVLLCMATCVGSARAADGPATPASSAGTSLDTASSEGETPFSYRVVVDAPSALTDVLKASVGLVRWPTYADMTDDVFDRLAREAID